MKKEKNILYYLQKVILLRDEKERILERRGSRFGVAIQSDPDALAWQRADRLYCQWMDRLLDKINQVEANQK